MSGTVQTLEYSLGQTDKVIVLVEFSEIVPKHICRDIFFSRMSRERRDAKTGVVLGKCSGKR